MGKCHSKIGCCPTLKNQEDAVSRSMALKGLQRQPTTGREAKEEVNIVSSGYLQEKPKEKGEDYKILDQDQSEYHVKKNEKTSCLPLWKKHSRRHRIISTSVISRVPSLTSAEQSQADRREKNDSFFSEKEGKDTLQDGRPDETDQNHPTVLIKTDDSCPSEMQENKECQKQEELEAERLHEIEQRIRRETEEKLHREMEERLRRETEEKLHREMEERLRRETEEKLHREMEERLRRETEEKLHREMEERLRKEIEEKLQREMEEHLRKEIEAKLQREAEEHLKKEAEAKLLREAEEHLRKEAEEKLQREREERLTREAEEKNSKTLLGHTGEEKYAEISHWKYETPIQSYRPSLEDTHNNLCIKNRIAEEKQSQENGPTELSPSRGTNHRESSSLLLVEGLGNPEFSEQPPMCGLCRIFGVAF